MSPYREWIQKQNDFLKRGCINPKTILYGRDAILRVCAKLLIFNMVLKLWADVKYHVPTGFGFSPKASGFYPFDDATALAGEGDVGDVACLIQASASNHKPKGRFFWFVYAKGICLSLKKVDS